MFLKLYDFLKHKPSLKEGIFIGEVVENKDPKKIGRIKVYIPGINDQIPKEKLPWTYQVYPIGTGENKMSVSTFIVPGIGSKVIIVFPTNDPLVSFYIGELRYEDYQFPELKDDYPETYGFQNKKGDKWYVNMKKETVDFYHHSGTKMHIRKDGTVDIKVVKDVNIDVDGNVTTKIHKNWSVFIDGETKIISKGNMILKGAKIFLN